MSTRRYRTRRPARRDAGSTLVLILVLVVIAGLVMVPTLNYTVAVLRQNQVLSQSTAEAEAVKAGLRVALGDPRGLYETCVSTVPAPLSLPVLDVETATTCQLLSEVTRYQPSDLPWDVSTTWFGVGAPDNALLEGEGFDPDRLTSYTGWQNFATPGRIEAPTAAGYEGERSIWLPNLATRTVTLRGGTGFEMPVGEYNPNFASCTVYFPGTYPDPVTISGPSYFASGVYYFESTLTIGPGSSVVMGSGQHEGCTDDQRAAFSAIGVPSTHNITGVGVTIVFGKVGRLDIDDGATGPIEFKMNTRFVAPEDIGLLASQEVSIATVNGSLDPNGAGTALDVPGGLSVPASMVASDVDTEPAHLATADGYSPSTLVPVPAIPPPPGEVSVDEFDGAVTVSWQPPSTDAFAAVTGYTATATDVADPASTISCDAPDFRPRCSITGLTNGKTYRVTVTTNTDGPPSRPSNPIDVAPSAASSTLAAPGEPTMDAALEVYDNMLVFAWSPPIDDGGAPITSYTVEVPTVVDDLGNPIYPATSCTSDGRNTTCATDLGTSDPDAIAANTTVTARVSAETVGGVTWSASVEQVPVRRAGETYVAPTVDPPTAPAQSDPTVRIATSGAQPVTIDIPGYVAVPQGWIEIDRADGTPGQLRVDGAVLASWIAMTGCDPTTCIVGQGNEPTQRVIRIRTELTNGGITRSDAIVQINANGAWAVNTWEVQRRVGDL